MKTGMELLSSDRRFKGARGEAARRYGEAEATAIWAEAGALLEELLPQYSRLPKLEREHLTGNLLRGVAVYKALLAAHPEDALEIMDGVMAAAATGAGKKLGRLVALPGMRGVFMWLFARIGQTVFGPAAGFRQKLVRADRREVALDIYDCPYCKYCQELGCPELTRIFCASDEYSYGSLPGIRFARTQTLAGGGDRCDFRVIREE